MPKSAQAFRTIREVADWLDVAAHVLRFWESKFNQIKPVKRAGGRRYYRPADMELVGGIKVLLHDRGLTIRGVQKLIADEGVEAVTSLSPSVDELIGNGEVIDLDPSSEWAEDAAAEASDDAPNQPVFVEEAVEDVPEAAPVSDEEIVAEHDDDVADDNHSDDHDQAAQEAPLVTTEPPDTDPIPEALPDTPASAAADVPEEEIAAIQAQPSPPPSPQETTPTPASPAENFPHSNPAEGTLGTLVAISNLPPTRRAALAPQIAALAHLRDQMSAPH